jgi:hypothetical protein
LAELILKFKRDNQRYISRPVKKRRGRFAEDISLEEKMEGDSLKTNEDEHSPPLERIERIEMELQLLE